MTASVPATAAPAAEPVLRRPSLVGRTRAGLSEALADPSLRRRLGDAAFAAGENLKGWDDTAGLIAHTLRMVDAAESD